MNKNVKYFFKNFKDQYNYKELFKLKLFYIPVVNKSKKILFFLIKNEEQLKNLTTQFF